MFLGMFGASPASPDHSGKGDTRSALSNLQVVSWGELERQDHSRSEYKTNVDVSSGSPPGSSERGGVDSKRIQRLTAEVQGFKAQLQKEKQSRNERIQAHVQEARAELAKKQTELEEVQRRLAQEQKLRTEDGDKLRKANVLVQGKHEEMKNLQAEHDRLQAIVEDRKAARLLSVGVNIQAAYPTLPEIEAHIRRALTVTVSEWIEEVPPGVADVFPLPWVLSRVFLECRELVDSIVQKNTVFMNGGVGSDGGKCTMDEATVDVFRQHVRRHHRTLFPLTGEYLQRACTEVIFKVGHFLLPSSPDMLASAAGQELMNTKLDRVVAEYLPILVAATLQHPALVLSNDCEAVQRFDATIHAESIDGSAVKTGQGCVVVFPAFLVEREGGQGLQPLSKPYILPIARC